MGRGYIKPNILVTTKILMIGAVSFTAALAWRDMAKKLFEIKFGKRTSLKKYVLYALTVTIAAILIVYFLSAMIPKQKKHSKMKLKIPD